MKFNDCAIPRYRFDPDADNLRALQLREHLVQHTAAGPAVHARVDRVPTAEARRQTAPLAALFGYVKDRIEHLQIRQTHIAALARQAMFDLFELGFGDFHLRSINSNQCSVNAP